MSAGTEYSVCLWLAPSLDLYHASKVLSGLAELRRLGTIDLSFRSDGIGETRHTSLVYLHVRRTVDGQTRRLTIDLADRGDDWSSAALESADVYFKRSYRAEAVADLPAYLRNRVRPFGLNFSCLTHSARAFHARLSLALLRLALSAGGWRESRTAIEGLIGNARLLMNQPDPSILLAGGVSKREKQAIYQTRIWPPEQSADDLQQLNRERRDLVRVLRESLGERFIGGIQADPYSREQCPDLIVEKGTHRFEYLELTKRCLVGIYSRGVHHSMGFKLPEYMATGLCMVAEPFRYELPVPLESGKHYLEYRTPEECASRCIELMEDVRLANTMSKVNREYYESYVEPIKHVRAILDSGMSSGS